MKNKNNYILKVYVDSSFDPESKQAYCCYCLGGMLIDNKERTEFINLGKSSDSAYTEYLGIEKTLCKIEKYLRASNISKSKVKLIVYSDLQSFARQYNKSSILKKIGAKKVYWVINKEKSGDPFYTLKR